MPVKLAFAQHINMQRKFRKREKEIVNYFTSFELHFQNTATIATAQAAAAASHPRRSVRERQGNTRNESGITIKKSAHVSESRKDFSS